MIKNNPTYISALKQYEALPDRDQKLLQFLIVVLVLCVVYFAMWMPAHNFMKSAQDDYESKASLLALVEANKSALRQLSSANSSSGQALDSQQLVSSVTNLAKRQGIALKRFEPSGQSEVKVWVEDASFDKMLAWVSALQKSLKVRVIQISVEKEEKEGEVSARLTLAS